MQCGKSRWKCVYEPRTYGSRLQRTDPGVLQGTEDEKKEAEKEIAKWDRANVQAQDILISALDNRHAKIILNCQTAQSMWARLVAVHDQRSAASMIVKQSEFFDMKMQLDESVSDYIARAENCYNQLTDIGAEELTESTLVSKIVSCLPGSYFSFMSNWAAVDQSKHKMIEPIPRLMAEC